MRTAFTVTTTVTYFPARLGAFRRYPRAVRETFPMTVDIASVTGAEAPVAASFPKGCPTDGVEFPEEGLRFFEGSLYALDGNKVAGSSQFPLTQTDCIGDGNRDLVEEVIRAKYAQLLIVDGRVWAKVGEPSYWIETTPSETKLRIVFFRTAGKTGARDFSVHEPEAAVREATKIAAGTGDGESVAAITKGFQPLEVVIPEAFTFETQQFG